MSIKYIYILKGPDPFWYNPQPKLWSVDFNTKPDGALTSTRQTGTAQWVGSRGHSLEPAQPELWSSLGVGSDLDIVCLESH